MMKEVKAKTKIRSYPEYTIIHPFITNNHNRNATLEDKRKQTMVNIVGGELDA